MPEESPIRKTGPYGVEIGSEALDKARQKAEAIKGILQIDKFMRAIDGLLVEIKSATLAKRFSITKGVNPLYDLTPGDAIPNPNLRGLTETERKKMELEIKLRKIQNDLLMLGNTAEAIILDFEASKIGWSKLPETE